MNYGPGRIWWRGEHARLEKWWRCSSACISKLYLDRHHQSKLKLKFNLCLSNFCQQNFQNIVTWGVELQSRNTIFACISMESLISGVLPYGRTDVPVPALLLHRAVLVLFAACHFYRDSSNFRGCCTQWHSGFAGGLANMMNAIKSYEHSMGTSLCSNIVKH